MSVCIFLIGIGIGFGLKFIFEFGFGVGFELEAGGWRLGVWGLWRTIWMRVWSMESGLWTLDDEGRETVYGGAFFYETV